MKKRRIGIMGGTFDPVHIAHLRLAECAYEQFQLDEVLFMPSGEPPHKKDKLVLEDNHRANMVKLAIGDNPHFTFSDIEIKRDGFSYTSDTLIWLCEKNPNAEYYFIVGADSLNYMEKWHNPQDIFDHAVILAANREQLPEEQIDRQIAFLHKQFGGKILKLTLPNLQVSSHMLRELAAEGKSIRYYVPESVRQYIEENNLYQNEVESHA